MVHSVHSLTTEILVHSIPKMHRSLLWALAVCTFSPVSSALPASGLTVSTTARCGSSFGLTCQGSTFGSCCSKNGYCGSTSSYCGTGCQSTYGTCTSSTPSSASVTVSKDGSCGGSKGYSCLNSVFGSCCRLVQICPTMV
jgi:hypothetical protein